MTHSKYTLPKGLWVHPVHVSQTNEDGQIMQERFWATVTQGGDHSHVHARIDVDVLQPTLQGLHYGKQTVDEMGRRKRRQVANARKEEAKEKQKKKEQ